MYSVKWAVIAILIAFVFSNISFSAERQIFTSEKFLACPAQSQLSFINASVLMAGLIADQNEPQQARCLKQWSAEQAEAGYPDVTKAMERFPEYHPSGVLLAVMQKQCGTFSYAE